MSDFDFGFDGNDSNGLRTDVEGDTSWTMFDSLDSQMKYVREHNSDQLTTSNNDTFLGRGDLHTVKDLERAAAELWPEGVSALDDMLYALKDMKLPEPKSRKRKTEYNDDGDGELDLERLQQGEKSYRKTERESTDGPQSITIVADMSTPYYEKSINILWRGAAALVLTHMLEAKGYRVELHIATVNASAFQRQHNKIIVTSVCLKKTSDPLDMAGLTNAVSGWWYRAACFETWHATAARNNDNMTHSLGVVRDLTPKMVEKITPDEEVLIVSHVFSQEAAMGLIVNFITKLRKENEKEEA